MKKIIPVFLVSASLLGGVDLAYAAKASNPEVWADSQAKEWGDTPDSVKYVLSNVQISRSQGANGNKKQTDLFSTKWLKEMQRSPSTYRLSSQDQKWVDNVLANAEAKNSGSWKPSNKTPKAPAKRQAEPKAETVSAPVIPKTTKQNKSVFSDDNTVAVKEKAVSETKKSVVGKEVNKPVKAESKALPKPVIVAKEKPDLTPIKPKETVKIMSAEDEKAAKEALAEKARVSEQDAFVATLPVIADSDMEINPIDEVKQEVLDMRNEAMEARIQELDEQEAAKEEEREKTENEAQEKSEPNVAVIKEDGVKQIVPLNDPVEAIKQDVPANVELTHVKPALKESDVLPINSNNTSQMPSTVVSNDTSWISSALISLGSISAVMFLLALAWIRRVVSNGTANKYF